MRQLVYYVAVSMDGFIAGPDGDTSRFVQSPELLRDLFGRYPETCPVHARGPLGVDAPPTRFDTVLMGRATYQPALDAGLGGGAYPHLRQVVVTHQALGPRVETTTGDVASWVADLKRSPGRDIWLCGGGSLAGQLADEVDEVQLKINPVSLGSGVRLFGDMAVPQSFRLEAGEPLPGGVLLVTYRR